MGAQDLKNLLHEGIENISDTEFLLELKSIMDRKYSPSEEPHLAAWQIKKLEDATAQVRAGNYLTDEEANQIIDQWLKK